MKLVGSIVEARNVSNLAANTPTKVSTNQTELVQGVRVSCPSDNTGPVWIGKSDVATSGKGFGVYPGESHLFAVADATQLYMSDSVGNQSISILLI